MLSGGLLSVVSLLPSQTSIIRGYLVGHEERCGTRDIFGLFSKTLMMMAIDCSSLILILKDVRELHGGQAMEVNGYSSCTACRVARVGEGLFLHACF